MTGLTWLHLSDWHQRGREFDRQIVRAALIREMRDRTAISPDLDKIDFIIFSGDVAYNGKAEEYAEAKTELFDPLLKACGLNPDRLFIVPGNHDLDISKLEMLPAKLSQPLKSEVEVQSWLTDKSRRPRLLEPFEAFTSFVKYYTGQNQPDYSNIRKWKIDSKEIAVLGLNSAWMCGRNRDTSEKISDKGFVLVGEPQIHDSLEKIAGADLRIAVLHHPFDWLAEFDCNRIEERLKRGCNFILRGHQHKQKVEVIHGTFGDSVVIPAGACYNRRIAENPVYVNSYNFVHLDFDTGKGIVFLRRWSDPRTKWVEDIDSCDGGKFEFRLFESTSALSSLPFESFRPSSYIIPHQIPSSPADFKGREDEISDIISNFEKGASITGLRGMGGIGKTALALILAEKLKDRFPDGQIFIDMRGTSVNPELPPVTPVEAMAQVIRAYSPVDRVPENPVELRGLYLSILTSKRTLLLLDNAANNEQVEPLLPPAGCSVLITSRIKFTLPGLMEKDLNILPLDKARELLLEIAPRIGSRAEELAKLCGCLPLALRNAARALAEKQDLSVSEYERRLREKVARLELVKASFSLSYELLTSVRKKQWRRLSVFPEDFDRNAAIAVLKMAPDPASEALSYLVKWSLVDFIPFSDSEDGRYRLHELARLFAESCLEPHEIFDARQKHSKHYLKVLSEADELYLRGEDNLLTGLELFDREWANIKVGQSWTKSMIRISRKPKKSNSKFFMQMQMAISYANDGINVLYLRLHPRDRISWLDTGLTAARNIGHRRAEGAHLGNLGNAYSDLGDTHKAIEYYDQALAISREIGDRRSEGANLGNLGNAYSELGDTHKAIEYQDQALAISREISDRRNEGVNLGNLGMAYSDLNDTHKAIEYFDQALAISREIGDRLSEGADLGNLGNAYSDLGDTHKVIEYYDQALAIAREIGDRRNEGADLGNLGNAYSKLGNTHKAIEYHDQALDIAREISDRRSEGSHLGNLGNAYSRLGDTRKSIEYYHQALTIAREISDRRNEGTSLDNLGNAYSKLGYTHKAIEYHDQALVIFREISDRRNEGTNLDNLGNAYSKLGYTHKAIEYHDQALAIFREIGDRRSEGNSLDNLGNFYSDLGDTHKAIEYYDQTLAISREIGDRRSEGNRLDNLGNAYLDLGDTHKAIEYYDQAVAISREIGDRRSEGNRLDNLGNAYLDLGDTHKAIEYYDQAVAISQEIGDRRSEGNSLDNLGNACSKLGDTQKAIDCYEESLAISREIGDSLKEANALWNIGLILDKRGDNIKAVYSVDSAYRIFLDTESPFATQVRYWLLNNFVSIDGQVRQAVIDVLAHLVSSDESVRKHILLALKDKNINTRNAAVNALSSLVQDDRNVRASILEMLNDSDIGIQQAAAAALGKVALDDEIVRRALSSFWAKIAPNYLDTKAHKFFEAAGFSVCKLKDEGSFKCVPNAGRWQGRARPDESIYMRCLSGIVLDQDLVVEMKKAAQAQADSKMLFVVVDKQPSRSGLIAIGALRSEGIKAIIIGDAVIQHGIEEQKEHEKLEDHLSLHLESRRNYYNVRTPVTDQLAFFGREIYTNHLFDTLSQGRPIALFGLRKMGKSSVLQYLRDKAAFPVAYVDLNAGSELSDLFYRILKSWQLALRSKRPDLNWNPPSLKSNPAIEFAKATRELMELLIEKKYSPQLGLFVDEIELIAPKTSVDSQVLESITLDRYFIFTRTLRGLLQETNSLSLIIAGVDPRIIRSNRFEGEQNPFYQLFIEEYLGPLSRKDCIQMIKDIGCQMDLEYCSGSAEFIADISGRHPFIARQLCSTIVDMIRQDEMTQPDSSKIIEKITLDTIKSNYRELHKRSNNCFLSK